MMVMIIIFTRDDDTCTRVKKSRLPETRDKDIIKPEYPKSKCFVE